MQRRATRINLPDSQICRWVASAYPLHFEDRINSRSLWTHLPFLLHRNRNNWLEQMKSCAEPTVRESSSQTPAACWSAQRASSLQKNLTSAQIILEFVRLMQLSIYICCFALTLSLHNINTKYLNQPLWGQGLAPWPCANCSAVMDPRTSCSGKSSSLCDKWWPSPPTRGELWKWGGKSHVE